MAPLDRHVTHVALLPTDWINWIKLTTYPWLVGILCEERIYAARTSGTLNSLK